MTVRSFGLLADWRPVKNSTGVDNRLRAFSGLQQPPDESLQDTGVSVSARVRPTAAGLPAFSLSAHVDVEHLDGVVSVAEAVPRWNIGLHVAGCVGRAGA